MAVLDELGGKIRKARRDAGYRNAELLAVELGVGIRTVQRWEQGVSEPSLTWLMRIAEVTDQPLEYFFTDNGVAA